MTQGEALVWTVLLELPPLAALAVFWGKRGADLGRVAVVGVAGTLITHPFAWPLGRAAAEALGVPLGLGAVEVVVALVEGALLWRFAGLEVRQAFGAAALINGWSTLVGLVPWMWRTGLLG